MLFSKSSFTAAILFAAGVVSAQKHTFQTSPASDDILYTNAGLVVKWTVSDGLSPDSKTVDLPENVSIRLAYQENGVPKALYPPLNGVVSNVPSASGTFSWNPMDFSKFLSQAPARDLNTKWVIQIYDQATSYLSNGQTFTILDAGVPAAAPVAAAPVAPAPVAPAPVSTGPATPAPTSSSVPTAAPNATSSAAPVHTTPSPAATDAEIPAPHAEAESAVEGHSGSAASGNAAAGFLTVALAAVAAAVHF